MRKFRKRPVVIEAQQIEEQDFTCEHPSERHVRGTPERPVIYCPDLREVIIPTLEGNMIAKVGDWIIRGVQGELYPCKPDIFEATYEPVDDAALRGEGGSE